MGWLLPEMDEDGGYVVTNAKLVEKLVRTTHVFTAYPERERERERERGVMESALKKSFSAKIFAKEKKPTKCLSNANPNGHLCTSNFKQMHF